jgi:hypothetical protein
MQNGSFSSKTPDNSTGPAQARKKYQIPSILLAAALAWAPMAPTAHAQPLMIAPDPTGVTPLSPEVIARFAPEIRLHPDEVNLPSSVDWYLGRTVLRFISHQDSDGLWQETYDPSPLTAFPSCWTRHHRTSSPETGPSIPEARWR